MNTAWDDPEYTPLANLVDFVHENIEFRDWSFTVLEEHGIPYLRVSFHAENAWGWENTYHSGRRWRLSYHMTKGEIVQTALKAVLTALEHEAREQFLYRGQAIFGPHLDPDALWKVAGKVVVRSECT